MLAQSGIIISSSIPTINYYLARAMRVWDMKPEIQKPCMTDHETIMYYESIYNHI